MPNPTTHPTVATYDAHDLERRVPETPKQVEKTDPATDLRSPFARDRARVLHSAALRRLADKTQVATFLYASNAAHAKMTVFIGSALALVVASGLDPNALDPLARMQAHSETFHALMQDAMELAGELCGGRIVAVHEGGYSEAYVPFCGLAVIEALAGRRSQVVDPFLDLLQDQQPAADMIAFQRARLEAQARSLFGG